MMDMVRRMRENRALLLAKREKRKKVISAYNSDATYSEKSIHSDSNLTDTDLIEVFQEIRKSKTFERKLVMTKTVGVMIAMFILVVVVILIYA